MNKTYMAPTNGELRVSHAEREPVIEQLKQAYAEGRLDHDEFDLRVHLAMTAKTRSDLAAITRDLAPPVAPPRRPEVRTGPAPSGEDRMLAAAAHAAGALTTFVGPLVLLLLSGKRSEYVRRHAAEALNFQLTLLLVTIVTFGLGGILYAVAWIACALAAVVALTDKPFRYPWTLRLIR
ncbi:DUF1707 and DUF4870 domain-containing protein [Actinomadura sp. HBU206391]|uniref:DUF1707 and DUF4870 domain-containing protein n=1 Tax=Actinomadura sp. HBU206391 TaxID=2731692 RepID=UPI0029058668|nr:DUF1707 and DUF4870 domain-containing protein [Actinomadura sp. HBU206391]